MYHPPISYRLECCSLTLLPVMGTGTILLASLSKIEVELSWGLNFPRQAPDNISLEIEFNQHSSCQNPFIKHFTCIKCTTIITWVWTYVTMSCLHPVNISYNWTSWAAAWCVMWPVTTSGPVNTWYRDTDHRWPLTPGWHIMISSPLSVSLTRLFGFYDEKLFGKFMSKYQF